VARRFRLLAAAFAVASACAWTVVGAGAGGRDWAASEIRAVTQVGVLGHSAAAFAPSAALTQSALASAIAATDALQHQPAKPAAPLTVLSTLSPNAVVAGPVEVRVDVLGREVDHVDLVLDGETQDTQFEEPFAFALDTGTVADGLHRVSLEVTFGDGGYAVAGWPITVANTTAAPRTRLGPAVKVPVTRSSPPAASPRTAPSPARSLYHASAPSRPVTIEQLDAALVGYLGLGGAAREIRQPLQDAGLQPRGTAGTEAVARLLGLRLNHPSGQDDLELLPSQPASRAEAAWSFAQALHLDQWATDSAQHAVDDFTLPELTSWQRRILVSAVHYVGYPYVWGGTSPTAQTLFGVHSVGGFDCLGLRVARLQADALRRRVAARERAAGPDDVPDERRGPEERTRPGGEAAARRRDVLRRARPHLEAERDRPCGALPRERLVHPVERPGRHAAALRRLVCEELRVGPEAAARGGSDGVEGWIPVRSPGTMG